MIGAVDESGSVLPLTMGLVFVALGVVALVAELALLGGSYRDIATVADLAAEAGASVLAHSDTYEEGVALDIAGAEAEAQRVGGWWGSGDERMVVGFEGNRVCVTVSDTYLPRSPVFLGVSDIPISATACAEPIRG